MYFIVHAAFVRIKLMTMIMMISRDMQWAYDVCVLELRWCWQHRMVMSTWLRSSSVL